MNRSICAYCKRPIAANFRPMAYCDPYAGYFCSFSCYTAHQRGPTIELQIGSLQLYWPGILRRSEPQ